MDQAHDELSAMKVISEALEPLDDAARRRALQWALSRFGAGREITVSSSAPVSGDAHRSSVQYENFADLFDAAKPATGKDKALVAAYWIQLCKSEPSFPSQALNVELKHLGHGIGNITEALSQLKNEYPALVLQLKKSGTSKQARKTYKLTQEGVKRVQQMIGGENAD